MPISSKAVFPFWLDNNSLFVFNFSNKAFGLSFSWTKAHNFSL